MARVISKVALNGVSIDDLEYTELIPVAVIDEMLNAEADVIEPEIEENARTMLSGRYSTGMTADALIRKAPYNSTAPSTEGRRQIELSYKDIRHDKYHKKGTRNGEIAFVNEYGARGIPARPFIQAAIDKKEKQAFDEAENIFDKWLKKEKMI